MVVLLGETISGAFLHLPVPRYLHLSSLTRFLKKVSGREGDRSHPEHREMREWVGKHFKPELFSVPQVNAALAFFISISSKP